MIVYAETNLILELTLGQEQCDSCRQLVDWARERRIALRLPAYAFYEARRALRAKQHERKTVKTGLEQQAAELARRRPFANLANAFTPAGAALADATSTETALLGDVTQELDGCISQLPFDRDSASNLEVYRALRLLTGEADLIIFAGVMSDLLNRETTGDRTPSIFVTRNSRDFRSAAREFLRPYSCELFTSYDAAVGRLRTLFA